jgi:hypothetical protein
MAQPGGQDVTILHERRLPVMAPLLAADAPGRSQMACTAPGYNHKRCCHNCRVESSFILRNADGMRGFHRPLGYAGPVASTDGNGAHTGYSFSMMQPISVTQPAGHPPVNKERDCIHNG